MSHRDRAEPEAFSPARLALGGLGLLGAGALVAGVGIAAWGIAAWGIAAWGPTPQAQADGRPDGYPPARTTQEALVELGRRLFFDPVASRSGARACASCHDPEHGFSDPAIRSSDDVGRTLRHSQTLLDGHLNPTAHWDGEFDSIEELVSARLGAVAGVRGAAGRGAHGAISEFGGDPGIAQLATQGGRGGGGGYGPPATPSGGPPSQPGDPGPGEPDDGDRKERSPTTPGEDDDESAGTGEDNSSQGDASQGDASQGEGPAAKDARTDRASRRKRDAATARTLPLDLTRLADVPQTIERNGRYAEAFRAAFDSDSVTTARMAEAIAAYCRSIRSTKAPWDHYRAGQREAISASAQRGLDLFRGRASCAQCHVLSGAHPTLTDFAFHNTGIVWKGLERGLAPGREAVDAEERAAADPGRGGVTRSTSLRRAFKTPTLRDLTRRGPYMHDGSLATLADVVRYYAAGGSKDKRQDSRLQGFKASDGDVADLVAFLESLTGDELPGRAPRIWHVRAERQRVRFLDARKQPIAGLEVALVPEGDLLPLEAAARSAVQTVVSDATGWIVFTPSCRTHVRLGLPEGLVPAGGPLIPDACRETIVHLPVDGRVTLVVAYEGGVPAPPRLVAEHELTMRLPGHPAPRTLLERVALHDLGGRAVASYQGWLRTDVPADVIVRFPGDGRARSEHRVKLTDARTLKLDLGS